MVMLAATLAMATQNDSSPSISNGVLFSPSPLFPSLPRQSIAILDRRAFAVGVRLHLDLDPKRFGKGFGAEHFLGRSLHQNAPIRHNCKGVAKGGGKIEVVDRSNNAQTIGSGALAKGGHHAYLAGDIKVGVWFVQQQRAAPLRQRFGNQRTLKFPAGKLSNRLVAQRLKVHQGNGFLGGGDIRLGLEPDSKAAVGKPAQHHQLLHGVAKRWGVALRDPSNAAGAFGWGVGLQRLAIKQNAPFLGGKDAAQKFQQCGFAGTIAADQPNKLAIAGSDCCPLNAKAPAIPKGDIAPRNRHWRRS